MVTVAWGCSLESWWVSKADRGGGGQGRGEGERLLLRGLLFFFSFYSVWDPRLWNMASPIRILLLMVPFAQRYELFMPSAFINPLN